MISCDFCGQRPVAYIYPVHPLVRAPLVLHPLHGGEPVITPLAPRDRWGVCSACLPDVMNNRRDVLVRRAIEGFAFQALMVNTFGEEAVLEAVKQAHAMFWDHRAGPPVRVEDSPNT